jgi:crossover junction endodeoxyribonuclease RuvC
MNIMIILGIDPGYAIVGFGVIHYDKSKFNTLGYGAITTNAKLPLERRLEIIYDELNFIIQKYQPSFMAVEKLYFTSNQKTAIAVAEARGIIVLAGVKNRLKLFEYTPLQVKQSVVGYGQATKTQVISMTQSILNLTDKPKLDDTADALAIAICHAHTYNSLM